MIDGEWKVMEGWKPHNTMTPSVINGCYLLIDHSLKVKITRRTWNVLCRYLIYTCYKIIHTFLHV